MERSWRTSRLFHRGIPCQVSASMERRKKGVRCPSACEKDVEKSMGFTVWELLVIIVMLGILAGIAIPSYLQRIEKSRIIKAMGEIREISKAIQRYQAKNEVLPANLKDVRRQNLLDPWGEPYQYMNLEDLDPGPGRRKDGEYINTDYDLYSMGKDGRSKAPLEHEESQDDIIRADNGLFIGPVSKY